MNSQADMIGLQIESLNLKGMKSLSDSKVSDLGFSDFVQKLKYIASKKSTEIQYHRRVVTHYRVQTWDVWGRNQPGANGSSFIMAVSKLPHTVG